MRVAVLTMSGTWQKYHYDSVQVMAFVPAKRSFSHSKNRSSLCITNQWLFMAYCIVLLFLLRLNKVMYLYCWIFGFQSSQTGKIKNPLSIRSQRRVFITKIRKLFYFCYIVQFLVFTWLIFYLSFYAFSSYKTMQTF